MSDEPAPAGSTGARRVSVGWAQRQALLIARGGTDAVYGHTSDQFPYAHLYRRLGYEQNPFLGHFAKDYFGESTDFGREFTRAFYQTVNQYWLDRYHLDGFRYDCVPNYWDGPTGRGYAGLVYETHQFVAAHRNAGGAWSRFFDAASPSEVRLIQCAEQLEDPEGVLSGSYSNCTWQNGTFDAAVRVARGDRGALYELGLRLGGSGYPRSVAHDRGCDGEAAAAVHREPRP